jgi:two-component system LytT family response regulator
MRYRAIVVDDEEIARRQLNKLLKRHEEVVEIIDEAANGIEAVEKINAHNPDVVFLDVQMPGMDGFEVLRSLSVQPQVVFTTAYDHYALGAFRENAVDYLLKPIDQEELHRAVHRFRPPSEDTSEIKQAVAALLKRTSPKRSRISVRVGDSIRLLKLDTIIYFQSDDKLTTVITEEGEFVIDDSIMELEEKLPSDFRRIHRSYIVNINYIKEIRKWFDRKYKIILTRDGLDDLVVSRRFAHKIQDL